MTCEDWTFRSDWCRSMVEWLPTKKPVGINVDTFRAWRTTEIRRYRMMASAFDRAAQHPTETP